MPGWFYNMPVAAALFCMYVVFGSISLISYWLNQKYFKIESNSSMVSIAQQTSITFGSLFIAFWIALNWQSLGNLKIAAQSEANAVLNLYGNTHLLDPQPSGRQLRLSINNYLNSVINSEYRQLEQGRLDPITEQKFDQLKFTVYSLPAAKLEQKITYHQLTDALNNLEHYRTERLGYLSGQMNGILLVFFVMLLVLICFWSACTHRYRRQLAFLVLLSQNLVILTSGWLILEIDRPFQGYFKVNNGAFVQVKDDLEHLGYENSDSQAK